MNEWDQLQSENEKRMPMQIKYRHEPADEETSIARSVKRFLLILGSIAFYFAVLWLLK